MRNYDSNGSVEEKVFVSNTNTEKVPTVKLISKTRTRNQTNTTLGVHNAQTALHKNVKSLGNLHKHA